MRLLVSCSLGLLLSAVLYPALGLAQKTGISREHHPWGRFKPGAWKLVRVVTETLDEKGGVAKRESIETKTTLIEIQEDGVTLELEILQEVAGKRFVTGPQITEQGFHGEPVCPDLSITKTGSGQVVIEGRKIPCKTLQLECPGPTSKTVTDVYYSTTVAPYILKRRSVTSNPDGKTPISETTVDVVAFDMPCKVLTEIKTSADVRAVHKHPKGTIITRAITSTDVPGGIISHRSKEVDKNGRVISRSTLELIDYGREPEPERTGLLGRKRPGRFRKTAPRLLPR